MAIQRFGQEDLTRSFSLTQTSLLARSFMLLGVSILAAVAAAFASLVFFGFNSLVSMLSFILVIVATFVVPRLGDTAAGYIGTVATGALLGTAIVPTVGAFILAGKTAVVVNALLSTGVIFAVLATFTLTTKRDFTQIGGFLFVAALSAMVVSLLNVFFLKSSMVNLAISYVFALVSCGLIMYRLSAAVRIGIGSAVELAFGLLLDLYNLFVSLLNILNSRD